MVDTYALYRRLSALPAGQAASSRSSSSRRRPTSAPRGRGSSSWDRNRAELTIRKRRRVQNHLGTVHVIAICNGLEAAMGALAEATIPAHRRWIPRGMEVEYAAKATTDITCVADHRPGGLGADR